jgi:predicted DCC family thiol-disulfide oxidoreductase YuxK
MKATQAILIYDGECRFCEASVEWIQIKLEITALSCHDAPLDQYGLTIAQCSREAVVYTPQQIYGGATAIAYLLQARGNRFASHLIKSMGLLSHYGYRWVASHRDSSIIKALTRFFEWRLRL